MRDISHRECDVRELHAGACSGSLRGPVLVDVEAVRSVAGDERVEDNVADVAGAKVRLDHERLVPAIRVHVPARPKGVSVERTASQRLERARTCTGRLQSRYRPTNCRSRSRQTGCTTLRIQWLVSIDSRRRD